MGAYVSTVMSAGKRARKSSNTRLAMYIFREHGSVDALFFYGIDQDERLSDQIRVTVMTIGFKAGVWQRNLELSPLKRLAP